MSAAATVRPASRRSAVPALLVAALCVAALAFTWVLAALVGPTHARDATALYDFTRLDRPSVEVLAEGLLSLLEPVFFVVWALVLMGIALRRGRARVALAVALVLILAPLSADLLKPLLAHPHVEVPPLYIKSASWPSGHASAAMALVWCALLVAPANLRRVVALLGVVFLLAVAFSLLILAWHMPSDVVGGYLLATLWAALAVAGLRLADGRAQVDQVEPAPCSPGAQSGSDCVPAPSLTARLRMNSMSDSRFR
ncbi:MAG TPA: phosphatase PAP2 family protein [Solirubrobacteraceae bacterium]|jgi:membrane-associated phospholipid phosphatase